MDKITALYARVSTDIQRDEGQSIPRQKAFLKKEAATLGLKNIQFFIDDGYSAKDSNRPAYQKLVRQVENNAVEAILVYKFDRISRSLYDLLGFIELLKEKNVEFISIKEKFDTATPMGRATINMLGTFAQLERETTVERVYDAMKSKHLNGEFTGGQPAFGFIIKDKKLYHDPNESRVVKLIYDKFEEIRSFRGVCIWLNKHGYRTKKAKQFPAQTVRRILTNSMYCGLPTFGKRIGSCDTKFQPKDKWITAKGNYEPIISEEQFERVQAIVKARGFKARPKGDFIYLLNGILSCGKCGQKMYGRITKRKNSICFYYHCIAKSTKGTCKAKNLKGFDLENTVLHEIKKRVQLHFTKSEVSAAKKEEDWKSDLKRIEHSINDRKTKEARLYDLFSDGTFDKNTLKKKISDIGKEIEELEIRKIEIIEQNNPEVKNKRLAVFDDIKKMNGDISAIPRKKLFKIIREVVEKVVVSRREIKVYMYEV